MADLSFTVRPGLVTGFLGPNGVGKSTTMWMILGLDVPTSGAVGQGRRVRDGDLGPDDRRVPDRLPAQPSDPVLQGRAEHHHECPGVTRVVLGTALYLTVLAVLSVGIGTLLRNTAASLSTVLGLVLVLAILTQTLPSATADKVFPHLPSNAGRALTLLQKDSAMLAPWTGFTVFCLYAVMVLTGAVVALKRRDV
ncbi:ATP-binding cassette domain-containing protein [Streptomyces sp. 3214.6]|uniref:ATP-binding cassette domain-containing protein n=1 Tax=Streptomyces sp. 3214.6 TaxID=1882757 RepID=UPI0009A80450